MLANVVHGNVGSVIGKRKRYIVTVIAKVPLAKKIDTVLSEWVADEPLLRSYRMEEERTFAGFQGSVRLDQILPVKKCTVTVRKLITTADMTVCCYPEHHLVYILNELIIELAEKVERENRA